MLDELKAVRDRLLDERQDEEAYNALSNAIQQIERTQILVNGALAGLDRGKYPSFGQLLDAILAEQEQP